MAQTASIQFNPATFLLAKVKDYATLGKLRLSMLVVFSALIGYVFALGGNSYNIVNLFWLALGGILVTGASNSINQIIERDIDGLMSRTQKRPLVTGRMGTLEAILAAGAFGVSGIVIITVQFNAVAGVLSALSLLSYAFVYTPLKRISPVAVFVGAIPGALPPMIGYVCATKGVIDFTAILLFSIQFLWQFPHFWSIAWIQYDDYKKAGIMLLPSASGKSRVSALQNIVYCFMLIIVSAIPYLFNMIGGISAIVIVAAGLMFLWLAINHYIKCDDKTARMLMFGSFLYLPVMQLALVFGKI